MAVWMHSTTYSMIYKRGLVVQNIKTREYQYLGKPGLPVIQVHDGMPRQGIYDYPTPQIMQEMRRIANTVGVMT